MTTDNTIQLSNSSSFVNSPAETDTPFDLSQILRGLLRNWWIVVGITIATSAAAALRVKTETPSYVGQFEMLVQPGSAETDVISNIPETLTSGERPQLVTVDNDLLKILESPKLLLPIVEEIKLLYPDYCPPPEDLSMADADDACYRKIAANLSVIAIEDSLDQDSTIIQAAFQDPEPEVVQSVLAGLSETYLAYSLETRQADIRRGIEFVEQKLPDLRAKVNNLQSQLQNLRVQNDIIDPASKAAQLSEQIGAFSQAQLEAEIEQQQVQSISRNLQQQLLQAQEEAASPALAQNPRYQTLLNTLLELDAEIAEARTIYTDAAPEMQVLKEQRQNLLALLEREGQQSQREIISQIRELETREAALQETLQGLNSDVDDLSGVARSYDDIQNELLISSENLNQFIAKREALQIDAAQREIPWELVTPPTTPQPIQSSLLRYLLLGTTLGLLLGVGVALLVDESIGIIHAEDELKRITRLPVLASIPNYEDVVSAPPAPRQPFEARVPVGARKVNGNGSGLAAEPSVTADDRWLKPYSLDPFSEAFRTLHTNLRLLGTGSPIRTVAVSSTAPGEGKTTVAMHLAEAAAVAGQRVLLIDADLRNPQIHQYLALSNEYGLTNLFGGNTNLPVIQKYPTQSNLYVMTAGLAPVEPARLLSSQGIQQLTDQIKTKFDLVIYDTPPLLGQSDALLVAAKTDGLLLVTQPGTLKQKQLERAMEQLQVASISVLGLVVREK